MGDFKSLIVIKLPSDEHAYRNTLVCNRRDISKRETEAVIFINGENQEKVFKIENSSLIKEGTCALSSLSREWAKVDIKEKIDIKAYTFKPEELIFKIVFSIIFFESTEQRNFDRTELCNEFLNQYSGVCFAVGQNISFEYKNTVFGLEVNEMEPYQLINGDEDQKPKLGKLLSGGKVFFEGTSNKFNLTGEEPVLRKRYTYLEMSRQKEMLTEGIKNFGIAMATRFYPTQIIDNLGLSPTTGILLYCSTEAGMRSLVQQIGKEFDSKIKTVNANQISNIDQFLLTESTFERKRDENSGPVNDKDQKILDIIFIENIDAYNAEVKSSESGKTLLDLFIKKLESMKNTLVIGITAKSESIALKLIIPGRLETPLIIGNPNNDEIDQIVAILKDFI